MCLLYVYPNNPYNVVKSVAVANVEQDSVTD